MGGALSSWFPRFFGGREVRVLILGLDNAGKTTILSPVANATEELLRFMSWPADRLHLNEVIQTVPMQITVKSSCFCRPYWRCYYPNTQALIYVVDSADVERLPDARQELLLMLEEEELKDVALAIIANKQDLPRALNEGEISMALGLPTLRDRRWSVFSASAVKGEGLDAAMECIRCCPSLRAATPLAMAPAVAATVPPCHHKSLTDCGELGLD
ncbi:ADP-ribosylation factor family protein [Cyclospora cayetanensis]|uniref:ADP-ribosylation factor family protein n=1 Tax=Cyclospora cayetanensis TaxID=88456 RepID=A0A1D3D6W4_9EIME|nr:ADP-ribosylation factor family protein [Cyclospora cayetanensis]